MKPVQVQSKSGHPPEVLERQKEIFGDPAKKQHGEKYYKWEDPKAAQKIWKRLEVEKNI